MGGLEPIHEAQERDRKDPFLQPIVPLEPNPDHHRTDDSPAKELTTGRSVRERARARPRSAQNVENPPPPDGGSFIINATELRAVNFTMTPTVQPPPLKEVRRSGRRAAVVSTPPQPPPTEYSMDRLVDDDIRRRCW